MFLTYSRKAFKNDVLIHESELTIEDLYDSLASHSVNSAEELIDKWNQHGKIGPIKWEYAIVNLHKLPSGYKILSLKSALSS